MRKGKYTMRHIIPTILAGLALAAGLVALPATPATLAASLAARPVAAQHDAPPADGGKRADAARGGGELDYVASVVGVTPDVLAQDLNAGQTLLQIAGGKFASADALADALAAPLKRKLDAAVAAGKMTAAQEADAYAQMHAAFARLAVTPHPDLATGGVVVKAGSKMGIAMSRQVDMAGVLATACHTSTAALQAALQAGSQSVLAICRQTNPTATADSLVAALLAPLKDGLDAGVRAGNLTADQEAQMLANARVKLTAMVTGVPPASAGKGA
jgi:hypothetical protein